MADKKNNPGGSSASRKASGGITKKDAVEKGLGALGNAATPTQLQKHIRERYAIDMDLKHISTAKAKLLKAAGQNQPAVHKPAVVKPPAKLPTVLKPSSRQKATGKAATSQGQGAPGISLSDIDTVKDLVERVGAVRLKKLIDVMAR
jgi:hypothetical protein